MFSPRILSVSSLESDPSHLLSVPCPVVSRPLLLTSGPCCRGSSSIFTCCFRICHFQICFYSSILLFLYDRLSCALLNSLCFLPFVIAKDWGGSRSRLHRAGLAPGRSNPLIGSPCPPYLPGLTRLSPQGRCWA